MSDASELRAVVFDVDGTLVDSERHGHRVAFNQAFEEFDLPYRWDEECYGDLLRITGGQRRIQGYLASKGVEEAVRADLAPALHARKTEIISGMIDEGRLELRAGAGRLLSELQGCGVRLAVATTGSRAWVEQVLGQLAPGIPFEVVVTGEEVNARKPDPEAFTVAVERLGSPLSQTVAVEDSGEGLASAHGAGLRCAIVVNGYTAGHDFSVADLVVDGFGEPAAPARVIADRRSTGCQGLLDVQTLARLL